jgi:Fe-S cluster biogenesis protein NfuA
MSDAIKITGELTNDPATCLFHVEHPILPDWHASFSSAAEGEGSALINHLFAVEGVSRVEAGGSTLSVTKNVPEPWPQFASRIGKAIREAVATSTPLISSAVVQRLESLPVEDLEDTIATLFEEHINPALASHGGFVRLVKIEGRDIHVEMGGGCQGCASSKATLKNGIERAIRQAAPQVRHVIDATDHAAGANPYFH